MRKLGLLLTVLFLISSCDLLNGIVEAEVAKSEASTTVVSGQFEIPLGTSFTGLSRSVTGLGGDILLLIGDEVYTISTDNITSGDNALVVTFQEETAESGMVIISYVSNLTYNGMEIEAAGSAVALIDHEVEDNDINADTPEGSDTFRDIEILELEVAGLPIINKFEVSSLETESPIVTVDIEAENIDIDLVTIRINDTYRVIDAELNSNGTILVSNYQIPLYAGANEIDVMFINTNGYTISDTIEVNYTAPEGNNSNDELLLVTLDWDSPTSDMDLHEFYFETTTPTAADEFTWHNFYANASAPLSYTLPGTGSMSYDWDDAPTTLENLAFFYELSGDWPNIMIQDMNTGNSFSLWSFTIDTTELKVGSFSVSRTSEHENYTGTLEITSMNNDLISGSLTVTYTYNMGDGTTGSYTNSVSFTNATMNPETYSERKLDVDDVEGFGPEHFTLTSPEDGYYVVAVHSFDMDEDLQTNIYVTIETGSTTEYYGPFTFTKDDERAYNSNINESEEWVRVADIRVTGGVATILPPDMTLLGSHSRSLGNSQDPLLQRNLVKRTK